MIQFMASQTPLRAGRKPGPKSKKAPKLEQLTVRLDPKIRFGLDLMARANHQSLAQAVEWSVRMALQTVRVNSTGTLANLVEAVFERESPTAFLYHLWALEPNLLNFEERSIVRLINLADDINLPGMEYENDDDEFLDVGLDRIDRIDFAFLDEYAKELNDLAAHAARTGQVDGWKSLRTLLTKTRKREQEKQRMLADSMMASASPAEKKARLTEALSSSHPEPLAKKRARSPKATGKGPATAR